MIALDTNVLLRFLVDDDHEQAQAVRLRFARAAAEGERFFVSDVAMCELVWVLGAVYGHSREEIGGVLARLLRSGILVFRDAAGLERALEAHVARRGDFSDHVILDEARAAGCTTVATFDRALLKLPGYASP